MTQKILVDDENRDTFIYMHSTKWFNLQSPGGRTSALCHILAMVRWPDERNTILFPVVNDSSDPEDDSDLSMEVRTHTYIVVVASVSHFSERSG